MSRESLAAAIPAGHRLLLDSTVLIAYLGGNEEVTPVATAIIDEFVRNGRNRALISTISVMEVLVRPLREGAGSFGHTLGFLTRFPNLSAVDVDLAVAHQAANLRAFLGFKPQDALVVATGFVAQVHHLVTNDERWLRLQGFPNQRIEVCYMRSHLPI